LPQSLCDLIARLHAKKPEDRFASAQELGALLGRDWAVTQQAGYAPSSPDAASMRQYVPEAPTHTKPAPPIRPRFFTGRWVAAAGAFLLLCGLGLTEATGVTNVRGAVVREFSPEEPSVAPGENPGSGVPVGVPVGGSEPAGGQGASPKAVPEPPAPSVHATWIKATALLPQDQQEVALTAKLRQGLPGFGAAFLDALPAVPADRQVVMVGVWMKERNPAFAGHEDAWVRAVPALPADAQVALVTAWFKERNPGLDGQVTPTIERGVVVGLAVPSRLAQDLLPLRALTRLRALTCRSTVGFDNKAETDVAVLRSLTTLETVNGTPVAQFWMETTARRAAFREWLKLVPALEGGQQVDAVAARLKVHNPNFDGQVGHEVADGVVAEFKVGCHVTNISPVTALTELQSFERDQLGCVGGHVLSDLSPLKKLKRLTRVNLGNMPAWDLTPLTGMKLTTLRAVVMPVRDLTPLKDMPLTSLDLNQTSVTDLSPLRGMKLTFLNVGRTGVTDLSPLEGMPLVEIRVNSRFVTKGMEVLRDITSLTTVGTGTEVLKAADFWERYDKGEFK